MKYIIGATIPVMSYGNLQPSIEVEADTFEEAQAIAMPQIEALWNKYGEKPLTTNGGKRKLIKAFIGGEIYYDEETHTYTNEKGEVYMSGSQYAASLEKPFELDKIADALSKKFDVNAKDIKDMWQLKGEVSSGLGTAIHKGLELYGKYDGLAVQMDKSGLHDNPIIKHAVETFYKAHTEKAEYEVFIVDHAKKRAGQVDRLVVLGDKHGRIEDYKTNATLNPNKLKTYWVQLNFYKEIMEAAGWKMEPSIIHHYNGIWKEYKES